MDTQKDMTLFTVRVRQRLNERIEEAVKYEGLHKSEFVRRAIHNKLNRSERAKQNDSETNL